MFSTTIVLSLAVFLPLITAAPPTNALSSRSPGPSILNSDPADNTTSPTPFTIIAAHSTSPIHLRAVEASNRSFFIGEGPTTFCPFANTTICPPGTNTVLIVSSGCALSVEVPGGQQVYVQTNGALGFTEAHSGVVPAGAATGNFTETLPAEGFGDFGFTGFGSPGGWLACPVSSAAAETGPWQVFAAIAGLSDADVPSGNVSQCIDFDALSSAASGAGAWQYD